MRTGMSLTAVPPLRSHSSEKIKMIKRKNQKETGSPWGSDSIAVHLFSLCDVGINVLGVEVRSELSVLITSFIGRKPRYMFAFSKPMGRSCNWHVHKP